MDVKEAGYEDKELIHLAQDRNQFWVLVNTMMDGVHQFSEILGTKTLTRSKFHTEDPQLLVAAVRSFVALTIQRQVFVHPSAKGT